ncbi:hypothetical protein [Deinococcus petrolearius]|uniref:Uncharacterized protein n=1 Tax=Deinococcus petrolearius TaxID=1751295 RepID=A0ABW1DN84_9DEIO
MRRTLALTALLLGSAQADAWDDIGTFMQSACSTTQQVGGNDFDWLCTISSSYGFLVDNIVNGDWEAFAREVMGQYGSQLVGYFAGELGSGNLNKVTADIDEALRGTYAETRSALLGAMTRTLRAQTRGQKDDNEGLPVTTAGGLADYSANAHPILRVAQDAGRYQRTADMFAGLMQAAKAKKINEQSQQAVESALQPAITNAAGVVGVPGVRPGFADAQTAKAKTALSTREVNELSLGSFNEFFKAYMTTSVAELQLLTEIAKQGALTNTQLLQGYQTGMNDLVSSNNDLKTELEEVAAEHLNEAESLMRRIDLQLESTQALLRFGGTDTGGTP